MLAGRLRPVVRVAPESHPPPPAPSCSLRPFWAWGCVGLAAEIAVKSDSLPFPLSTEEWFIIASFGLLSALTLCYMIIKATASLYAAE